MSTPLRRRALAVVVTISALTGLTGVAGTQAVAAATPSAVQSLATGTQATSTVLSPSVTSLSAADVTNPLRGQYRWIAAAPQPSTWVTPDLYDRDRTYWGRLEPSNGVFDFSTIDNGLADVGAKKAKFGFRVMAYCPGCWMEQSWRNLPPITPAGVPVDANGVPRWNDEAFLSRWERLMTKLGAKYASDPRLGYVDVGGFGKYGEWMNAGDTLTLASAKRIIAAVAKAFPTKHVLLSAVTDYTLYSNTNVLQWALATYPNLGVRSDCLGNPYMQKPDGAFVDVWKTRPFFTEWCINGDPVLALTQVKDYHVSTISSGNRSLSYDAMTSAQRTAYETALKTAGYRYAVTKATVGPVQPGQQFRVDLTVNNSGTAPTYDRWTVRLALENGSGVRVATLPMAVDLRKHLPGTTTTTSYLTAPSLAAGTYRALVEAVDPTGYSEPMRLANGSRTASGAYPLGSVPVGAQALAEPVVRVAGDNRYATSAAISAATFDPGVPVAYVATGKDFPDALSGAPAGGVMQGPVLLVPTDSIPTVVQDELTRLKPQRIAILGGSSTVTDAVRSALARFTTGTVTLLAGSNRYATSAAVSAATFAPGAPVAYVATGTNFPDALSGAPAGGVTRGPVLLVPSDSIPSVVQNELTRLKPQRIVILGGSSTVTDAVRTALGRFTTGTVTRLAGSNRYATSAVISAATFAPGVPTAYIATGKDFPDALSGAPAGGVTNGPVLLVATDSIPTVVQNELTRLKPQRIVILGGSSTVSDGVKTLLASFDQP